MTESGTATSTILFTDVVGSTELRTRLGEVASDQLFRDHQHQLATVVSAHHGRIVKAAGDGVMATFDAASDAVSAAIALQQHITGATPMLTIRVGVAAGDVSWEAGDCFGLPVAAAARLEGRASGGQILVSHVVRWLAGDRAGATYRSLGPVELRGLPEPVEVYEVSWEPLPPGDRAERLAVPLPSPLTLAPRFRFVGRRAEWEALQEAWHETGLGSRRVVLVGGEAGAGKTRLASEFARSCHDGGAVVLFGGCDSELALPYQPWVQALDHLVRALPAEVLTSTPDLEAADLVVLLPQLERLLPGTARPEPAEPEADRLRLFAAVTALLGEVGRRAPVVLLLDDLHWAGGPTLSLLRHLARTGAAERLLVIGTFRDTGDEISDPLAGCLADLRRLDGITRLRLDGLDEPSVERFVAVATGQELDQDLRRLAGTLTERSGGNAFYVGELWQHLVSAGSVHREGGRWVVRAGLADTGVPDSVREVVADRVARLSPAARSLLELAATAGQRTDLRVLLLAADLPADGAADGLDELAASGLLLAIDAPTPCYQFGHSLVRETVEAAVAPLARARLHLRVAESLEAVHEADRRPVLADLARQFAAAAPLAGSDRAVYYCHRAATQAVRSAAYVEAISHLDAALALVAPGSPEQVELLLDRGNAQLRDGRYVESMHTCRTAFDRARQLGLVELAAHAAVGFEQAVHMPGLPGAPAVEIVEHAISLMDAHDEALHARLQASLARAYSHAGRADEALVQVELALALARQTGDAETLGAALEAALISTSDPHRLLELAAELRALAARSTDPWHELYATSNGLRAAVALGDLDHAADLLASHRAASERGRYPAFQFITHAFDVVLALAAGRFDDAEAAAERAHLLGSAGNTPFDAGVYGLQMFAIRREQGRLAEVAPVLRLVASMQDDRPMWRPGLAALYAELDLLDEARSQLEALAVDEFAAIPRDAVWPACAAFLAEVCIRLGDAGHAALLYDELVAFRDRNVMVGMTICFGPADRYLGGLAALVGRPDAAQQHYRAALDLAQRSHSPVWEAHVQYDWAVLLASLGDDREAVTLGRQAHQTAVVLGMSGLAARPIPGEGTTPRTGQAAKPTTPALPDGLSGRELDVLQLVAAGRSNREIGEQLYISPNTAANHVRAILQKTASANRAEATAYAARHHLLEDPAQEPAEERRRR